MQAELLLQELQEKGKGRFPEIVTLTRSGNFAVAPTSQGTGYLGT